jgi:hypothetical protein
MSWVPPGVPSLLNPSAERYKVAHIPLERGGARAGRGWWWWRDGGESGGGKKELKLRSTVVGG